MNKSDIPIDAVITWVDASDKEWQKKINKYLKIKIDFNKKKESVRYNSIGEIDIAIKSIIKYASFVRNIFLVTDNQIPKSFNNLQSLAKEKGINLTVVDHKIIFRDFEDCLPCFNSCSIGTMLFRIPNLSEYFIVFNDDTFLMRETNSRDFFLNDYPVIRGKWKNFDENRIFRKTYYNLLTILGIHKKKNVAGFKKFQQTSAKLAGTNKYLRRFHTPVSVRKSTLVNYFKTNNILKNNVQYKFRNESQFIISSLSEHLEIKANTFIYNKNLQLTYFRSYKRPLLVKLKLAWFSKNTKKLFMTFQSLELADDKTLNYITNWIDNRIN